jgi:hypothetical protein
MPRAPALVPDNLPQPLVTQQQLDIWLRSGAPGSKLHYFTGNLATAAHHEIGSAVIRKMVWHAAYAGKIVLTQKRVEDGFEYYATKCRPSTGGEFICDRELEDA